LRLEHTRDLPQPGVKVAPVMRAEAGQNKIETRIGEWQALRRTRLCHDVCQAALRGGTSNDIEHLRREIVGDDLADMGCNMKADMAGATAEVEHTRLWLAAHKIGQALQVCALCVDRTVQIRGRPCAELSTDLLVS
jgi:hypothetical protein